MPPRPAYGGKGASLNPRGAPMKQKPARNAPERDPNLSPRGRQPITEEQMGRLASIEDEIETLRKHIASVQEQRAAVNREHLETKQRAKDVNRSVHARCAARKAEMREQCEADLAAGLARHEQELRDVDAKWSAAVNDPELVAAVDKARAQIESHKEVVDARRKEFEATAQGTQKHLADAAQHRAEAAKVDGETADMQKEYEDLLRREHGVRRDFALAKEEHDSQQATTDAQLKSQAAIDAEVHAASESRQRMQGRVDSMSNYVKSVAWVPAEGGPGGLQVVTTGLGAARELRLADPKGRQLSFEYTQVVLSPQWGADMTQACAHCVAKLNGCLLVAGASLCEAAAGALGSAVGLLQGKHPGQPLSLAAVEAQGEVQRDLLRADEEYHAGALSGGVVSGMHEPCSAPDTGRVSLQGATVHTAPDPAAGIQCIINNLQRRGGHHGEPCGVVCSASAGETAVTIILLPAPTAEKGAQGVLNGVAKLYHDPKQAKQMLAATYPGRATAAAVLSPGASVLAVARLGGPGSAALDAARCLQRVAMVDLHSAARL
eukprot:TRINITY_DN732_c0_g4_i1.p1 TRINITY_DN732_c0_g4~~TRINITY_DN732_c0_g4_i1.p1  ORF type:complete len:579 (+),score=219.04 TRINITY_DN732_c0_g4_i1:92-1738(+)